MPKLRLASNGITLKKYCYKAWESKANAPSPGNDCIPRAVVTRIYPFVLGFRDSVSPS